MAVPPGAGEPNPGQQTPGTWHPPTFIPQNFPPGTEPWWPAGYHPLPATNALTFPRVMLGIQTALWTLGLVTTPLIFFTQPPPPGVTSPYADLQAPSLARSIIILTVTLVLTASTVTTTFRLAPARPRMWWLALATQAPITAVYAWVFIRMALAPSPEGMAFFAALLVGPIVVAIPIVAMIALLLPSTRAVALGRSSRSSPP